jgi:hypothetical protein
MELEPWATGAARELHARFGSDVRLTVGALGFPQRVLRTLPPAVRQPAPDLDPEQISVALDGQLSVRSGELAHHGLLVSNLGSQELVIGTTGELIADVVDPAGGQVVGGYAGVVRLMLREFTVAPGRTERVPLLVATASFVPDLGYSVPPGQWAVRATLDPAAGHAVRTPALGMTVVG